MAGQSGDNFALIRYNSNGSLDTTFDTDGKVTTDFDNNFDSGQAIAIQTNGKIVVAGYSVGNFAVARYNSDGSLDTSFDIDGKITTDFGSTDQGYAVALQSDGKIVVAGKTGSGSDEDFALAHYNSNGSLDTSFDTDGKVITYFNNGSEYGYALTIQADGKIVVAGTLNRYSNNPDFAVARYNSDGSLDTSFDTDGKIITDLSPSDFAHAVTIQSNGKILVAGGI